MKDIRHLSKDEKVEMIRKEGQYDVFYLRGADLRFADLRGADLRGANLSFSDLRSADLSFSDLRSVDLNGANLSNANLRDAKINEDTKFSKIRIDKSQADIMIKKMFDVQETEEE